jgi:hypothetical protein
MSTMAIVKAGSTLEKGLRPFPTHECTNALYCPTSFKIIFKFERQVINPKLVKNKKNIKGCPKVGLHKDMPQGLLQCFLNPRDICILK